MLSLKKYNFLKLNNKGISSSIETAGMFLVMCLFAGLIMQISLYAGTQIVTSSTAYESARAASKAPPAQAVNVARTTAKDYGNGLVGGWNPSVSINGNGTPGTQITVTIKQKVPSILKILPQKTVTAKSSQIQEEEK